MRIFLLLPLVLPIQTVLADCTDLSTNWFTLNSGTTEFQRFSYGSTYSVSTFCGYGLWDSSLAAFSSNLFRCLSKRGLKRKLRNFWTSPRQDAGQWERQFLAPFQAAGIDTSEVRNLLEYLDRHEKICTDGFLWSETAIKDALMDYLTDSRPSQSPSPDRRPRSENKQKIWTISTVSADSANTNEARFEVQIWSPYSRDELDRILEGAPGDRPYQVFAKEILEQLKGSSDQTCFWCLRNIVKQSNGAYRRIRKLGTCSCTLALCDRPSCIENSQKLETCPSCRETLNDSQDPQMKYRTNTLFEARIVRISD